MKRLAGIGIIAGMIGVGLGLFFLLGGDWAVLGAIVLAFVGIGGWFAGLVFGGWLWDEVHWVLGLLVLVLVVIVAPPLILPLANIPWWFAYAAYGFGTAVDLIEGDKNAD